jgi:hypothetical protein
MTDALDPTRYHALHDDLTRLYAAPERDMVAIDSVIGQIDDERRRLKTQAGEPGNNPIERHRLID